MFKLSELLKNTAIKWSSFIPPDAEVTEVVSDSRNVRPGCMFVCLKGRRKDGHDDSMLRGMR